MPDRYTLASKFDDLRSSLARAERRLHLSQPVRSADFYAEAERLLDALTERVQRAVDEADRTRS